jgi:hypothetical protein
MHLTIAKQPWAGEANQPDLIFNFYYAVTIIFNENTKLVSDVTHCIKLLSIKCCPVKSY